MKKRILVVDDEESALFVLQKRLESVGYEVDTAGDGFEALKRVYARQPDMVLLDTIMPNLNGYQVCTILKRNPQYRRIPVLIMSESGFQEEEEGSSLFCVGGIYGPGAIS